MGGHTPTNTQCLCQACLNELNYLLVLAVRAFTVYRSPRRCSLLPVPHSSVSSVSPSQALGGGLGYSSHRIRLYSLTPSQFSVVSYPFSCYLSCMRLKPSHILRSSGVTRGFVSTRKAWKMPMLSNSGFRIQPRVKSNLQVLGKPRTMRSILDGLRTGKKVS